MSFSEMIQLHPCIAVLATVFYAMLGAVLGSFINSLAWRTVRRSSMMRSSRECPQCDHKLAPSDSVSVFSRLALRGKCHHCGCKVGSRHLVAEATCAAAFVGVLVVYGLTIRSAVLCALCVVLLGLSLVDLDVRRIPNGFVIAAIVIWGLDEAQGFALGSYDLPQLWDSLLGGFGTALFMLVFSMIFDTLAGKRSMGGGDIKLLFAVGLFLGLACSLVNLILSCFLGAVFGVMYNARTSSSAHESESNTTFPFGPAISLSTYITLLFGAPFASAYLPFF